MAAPTSFSGRFFAVLLPTKLQVFLSITLSSAILILTQINQVLPLLGIGSLALNATRSQLSDRFSVVITSPISATVVMVTFWATVGLISYLICWSAYNVLIEARNEVTLETKYTNRGHWVGAFETLGLKAVGGVVLIGLVALLKPGLSLWLALASPMFTAPTTPNVGYAVAAMLGLALQLYLIFACVLLAISPWYREEAFTDQ